MKLDEKIDNYLISMGCSILNDYSYIIDENVSFKVKPREEKVKIAGKEILLSTKVLATILLNQTLQGSNYVFMKSIHNVIQERGQNEIFELCEYINNASKVYYTDYIKFVKDKFDLTESIFENLTNLISANIQNTSSSIDKLLEKNHMQKLEAVQKAAADRSASDARIIAEAANKARTTYSKTFSEAGFLGGVNTYTQASMGKAMSDTELAGQFHGSAEFQADMERIYKNGANANTISELIDTTNRLVQKFNKDLEEILIVKFNDLFNKDVFSKKDDVEANPIYLDGYIELFDKMNETDVSNLKKVLSFYALDITSILENYLTSKIYEGYTNNVDFTYDKPIVNYYYELSNRKDLKNPSVQEQLNKYFKDKVDKNSIEYEKIKYEVEKCVYLDNDTQKKLISYINNKIDNQTANYNKTIAKMIAYIISVVINFVLIIFFIYAEIKDFDAEENMLLIFGFIFIGTIILSIFNLIKAPKAIKAGIKAKNS